MPRMLAVVGEALLTAAVAELLTAVAVVLPVVVAAVLTAIVKIRKTSVFHKGSLLSNAAGLLLSPYLPPANPKRGSATLCAHAG